MSDVSVEDEELVRMATATARLRKAENQRAYYQRYS